MKKSLMAFAGFITLYFFTSCQADLISEPNLNSITGSSTTSTTGLSAPENLSATHGGYRSVTLKWKASTGATRYLIYAADSSYAPMVQIDETKDASTSITIHEEAGISRYYCVRATDTKKRLSEESKKVFGSTIDTPIITDIENSEDGNSATVTWWMNNCSEKTYKSSVLFCAECYTQDKNLVGEITADGNTSSVTFTGLSERTTYYYQVSCYNKNNQNAAEYSDLVDAETAHRLIPNAANNFKAKQGVSKEYVELSFELPSFVDYAAGNAGYDRHPVYFTLERKLKDASDSSYETLYSYIGNEIKNNASKASTSDKKLYFYCNSTSKNNASVIKVEPSSDPDSETSTEYPEYIANSKICIYDKTASRGTQYTYRLQSYVDNCPKVISSASSRAESDGWKLSYANLSLDTEHTDNGLEGAEKKYINIELKFNFVFDSFGLTNTYAYVLTCKKAAIDGSNQGAETVEKIFESTPSYTIEYDESKLSDENIADYEGSYLYYFYVIPYDKKDSFTPGNASDYYLQAEANKSVIITNDCSKVPDVEHIDFKVNDGYADKFICSWNYDSNCTYSLKWQNCDENGQVTDDSFHTVECNTSDISISGDTATYEHEANSGDCRIYTLIADNGISAETNPTEVKFTLGTPDISFTEYAYDEIKVTWKKVQKVKDVNPYTVKAYYEDDSSKTDLAQDSDENALGYTQLETAEDGSVTCTIKKPSGYNSYSQSGKNIVLSVTASGEADSTTGKANVCTLGPALLNTTANDASKATATTLTVTWNKIPGAKGYVIHRVIYPCGSVLEDPSGEEYYYDLEKIDGNPSGASITFDNATKTYTLMDEAVNNEDNPADPHVINQSMISWGLPYGYVVVPVLDSGDFEFDDTEASSKAESSKVTYTGITPVKTATFGYGLDVFAHKAESATKQEIEWQIPYWKANTPTLYRRNAGSADNEWKKINIALSSGATKATVTLDADERDSTFEYAVAYKNSKASLSLPKYLISSARALSKIDEHYDIGSNPQEKQNKGYLLSVNFNAGYGGNGTSSDSSYYYAEKVEWDEWNYNERSVGPTSAYISIKNYNISSDWTKLVTLDGNLHNSSKETVANTTIKNDAETEIYLKPTKLSDSSSVTDGSMINTAGPLMVLRDAKHYYSLTLERAGLSEAAVIGEDDSVYGYRQISDAEIIRTVTLILADTINKTGINGNYGTGKSFGAEDQVVGSTGYFQWGSDSGSNLKWQITNFTHYFDNTPGNKGLNSFITISDLNSSKDNRGAKQSSTLKHISVCDSNSKLNVFSYPSYKSSGLIPVKVESSEIQLETFNATVGIASSKSSFTATVTRNGKQTFSTGSISGEEKVKRWCPVNIDDSGYNGKNSTYGWWN